MPRNARNDWQPAGGAQLVELLGKAGEKDLAAINERISQVETELADTTKRLRGELDGLRLLKKSIKWRLHGKPKRKSPTKRKGGGRDGPEPEDDSPSLAEQAYDLIASEGPMPVAVIAKRLGRKAAGVGAAIYHSEWFERNSCNDVCIAIKRK